MILGIDPGKTGAAALYDAELDLLTTYKLPTRWAMVNKRKRFFVDFEKFKLWLVEIAPLVTHAIVENPTSMPGQCYVRLFVRENMRRD